MEVVAEQLDLPAAYGSPSRLLAWEHAEQQLTAAKTYWLATTRPDGRPHTVPVDGLWLDGALFFGGDPASVHVRNLVTSPRAIAHLESCASPVIVEGIADWHTPDPARAGRLAQASKSKYGYGETPDSYQTGVWRLRPTVAMAWTVLYQDATRFRFSQG